MRLVTYGQEGQQRFGALCEEGIADLTDAFANAIAFLEGGEAACEKAGEIVRKGPRCVPVDGVKLCAPVPGARKLICAASNYAEHIREGGGQAPQKARMTPWMFLKPASTTLIGPGDPIVIPRNAQQIDWECELAVVIGRSARFVSAEEAQGYVAGYTILNDVSERSLKIEIDREPREWDRFFDWLNGKWFDTFGPSGPCLTLTDEIPDPQDLRITLRVNGEVKQDGHTGQMIHTVAELVAWCSRLMTLEPGDMIATGTPSGVGKARGEFLKPGDVVVCEIEKIGMLSNPVEAERI